MERLTLRHDLPEPRPRRGVLLLIALSLLTLFMMLGATYMVLTARARATAKAFANSVSGSQAVPSVSQGQAFVDEAFLRVVRGSPTGSKSKVATADTLLGDKYGDAAALTGTISSATGSIVIAIEVAVTGSTPVEALSGRVLTFTLPGLRNVSVRILRAEPSTSGAKLFIPAGPTLAGASVSAAAITSAISGASSPHFRINGREFSGSPTNDSSDANEPYDGFDGRNDFLANPMSPSSRPSFLVSGSTSGNLSVDNDGDGTADSGWIDIGLPSVTLASGQVLYPRAAFLIADLDGRVNLNAHGNRNAMDIPGSQYPSVFLTGASALTAITSATTSFAANSLNTYPRGLGYGPAEVDVDAAKVFESKGSISGGLLLSGINGVSRVIDSTIQRMPPRIGQGEGRYGGLPQISANESAIQSGTTFPRPGDPYVDDAATQMSQAWLAASGASYFANPLRYASPPDLKGRARIFLDDFGQPVVYKPYWSTPGDRPTNIDDETIDDPYEVDLSRMGPRCGAVLNPTLRSRQAPGASYSSDYSAAGQPTIPDNLFTVGELEGLLRLYEVDSPKLPRRVVALCGTQAGASRLLLTTDSWDTSAMTARSRAAVSALISGTAAMSMFAPETLMGHKFDLNRPFHPTNKAEPNDTTGRQERLAYAKHLYSLLYAIAGNGSSIPVAQAKEIGQWVANIVDFRDADSVMTGFEFDTNLTNGWDVDGDLTTTNDSDRAVAWGSERPEVLISETVCWHDRRTDDLTVGSGNETQLIDKTDNKRDDDFDQRRRPQGAFFVELYSPWESQAAEYDAAGLKAVRRTLQSGSTASLRAEPISGDLATTSNTPGGSNAVGQFDIANSINLSGTAAGGSPVWRLLTIRRTTTQGTEPTIVDPSATVVSGTAWRTMYFVSPPKTFVTGTSNGDSGFGKPAYWPSVSGTSSVQLQPQKPLVLGTGTWGAPGTIAVNTVYQHPTSATNTTIGTRPMTLTEPAITAGANASQDPYEVLAGSTFNASGQLATAQDQPLDDKTDNTTGITKLTGPDGLRTLFQNGRHANYFVVHLQRLANPAVAWDLKTNPYVTVDTQPVDLVVMNLDSAGANNYDEPCINATTARNATPTAGGPFSDLRNKQRQYDDPYTWTNGTSASSGASNRVSLERGRTQLSTTGLDRDIWSARINPKGASDTLKLLSNDGANDRSSRLVSFPNGNQDGSLVSQPNPPTSAHTLGQLAGRFGGGTASPDRPFPWLVWVNRPFVSAAELCMVPKTSPFDLLRSHASAVPTGTDALSTGPFGHLPDLFEPTTSGTASFPISSPWAAIAGRNGTSGQPSNSTPSIWDAVHVPTPFGGSYQNVPTTTSGTAALAALSLDKRPFGQLPHFREPGRINVNTMTGAGVWSALLSSGTAGTSVKNWGDVSTALWSSPATTLPEALATVSGTTRFIDTYAEAARKSDSNAFFRYQTVNRLTNLVTVRSNVFAVWVTIGYSTLPNTFMEAGLETGEVRRHRGFYIFDRSIPVGFSPGEDLNVRDAVLLRRIIQ